MVAPAYYEDTYVDTELSANLDSTFAFEGPEKLLEIWLYESERDVPRPAEGLRAVPLADWVDMLDLVNCKVLSMKSLPQVDAYLLSELSMFVFSHKLILKTCGTTTTLSCLDKFSEVVRRRVDALFKSADVARVFYSRRSFMFPHKQKHVHRDWRSEVALLSNYFDNGKSYVVGDFSGDDHWYLYMGGQHAPCSPAAARGADQTFEVMMTELDPQCAAQFVTLRQPGEASMVHADNAAGDDSDLGHDLGLDTMARAKLDCLFLSHSEYNALYLPSPSLSDNLDVDETGADDAVPGGKADFIHDAFAFTPCGYLSNSVSKMGNYYYTLHITPESGWLYASFETNFPFHRADSVKVTDVLTRILDIFRPGKFLVTFFSEGCDNGDIGANFDLLSKCPLHLQKTLNYQQQEKVSYDLRGDYKLLYLNFSKV